MIDMPKMPTQFLSIKRNRLPTISRLIQMEHFLEILLLFLKAMDQSVLQKLNISISLKQFFFPQTKLSTSKLQPNRHCAFGRFI